jgi:hypothetical protein
MTRRELMARMGSDELMEWLAFNGVVAAVEAQKHA